MGAFQPAPFNATYSATKAFVLSFTEAVHEEAAGDGVHVTCLCPGFTRTEFQQRAGVSEVPVPGLFWQSAEVVARIGLKALDRNDAACVAGLPNKLLVGLEHLMPRLVVRKVATQVTKRF